MERVNISVQSKQWRQFAAVSAAKGLAASTNLRLVLAEYLRREDDQKKRNEHG